MKLLENSLIRDFRLILNAPSNNKNNNANVVNIGANPSKFSGATNLNPCGPIANPNAIRNKMSGISNFLNMNSAKKPKNKIKLIVNKTIVTTSIVLKVFLIV